MDPWPALRQAARELGLVLDPEFEPRAQAYCRELAQWNPVARLTGYQGEAELVRHLILESLLLLVVLPEDACPVLDIGSGAGVPGLMLKLARPGWQVTLVEANRRRANFLRHMIRTLGLVGIDVRAERAESLGRQPALAGTFQTVTLRAVAGPREAARLASPFLRPEGMIVIPLGPRGGAPPVGQVREVRASWIGRLPAGRRFLIIRATDLETDVSRGTRGEAWRASWRS